MNKMMFVTGIPFLVFLSVTQLSKGQECSDLDKSLQKQWFRISATIEFSATSVGIDWFGNGILTFSCVQETGGFRLYRIDVPRDFIKPWICIKIVNTNLPGYLHLSFGSSETSDFCTNCKVYPAVVFTDSPNNAPEPPVLMPCNKPGICPVTDSTDVLCPKTSELNLFCQRLMIILNGESSEDDSTEDDDSDDSGDFRARLLARAKGGKKIGQLLNGGVKGNGKGKKLGHCKKKLAEEIILQCEPVTEPAIAE